MDLVFDMGKLHSGGQFGHIVTEETRKKISIKNKGLKRSEEYSKKISLQRKGRPAWNKGKTGTISDKGKKSIGNIWRGKHLPKKTRLKMSLSHKGDKCTFWKGGIAVINYGIRKSYEYGIWRSEIFERDNFTCQICNNYGQRLNAHHIKKFSNNHEKRMDSDNGITLCKSCHFGIVNGHEQEWESYFNFVVVNKLYD